MQFDRWNNGDSSGDSQGNQQNLNPSFAERQNLNNQTSNSWEAANQSLTASGVLPQVELTGMNGQGSGTGALPPWMSGPMSVANGSPEGSVPGPGASGTGTPPWMSEAMSAANGSQDGSSSGQGGWHNQGGWDQGFGRHHDHHDHHHRGNQNDGSTSTSPEQSQPGSPQALANQLTSDLQQLQQLGLPAQDLANLQKVISDLGQLTGQPTTPAPPGETTGTTTPGSSDPVIQQFAQSDPELAQILTDSQSKMSPQGFSQFEQTVAQNWATGRYPDDATLLQQSLSQFQQQGGTAADITAASNVIQSDLQTYGDSAVSTYQGGATTTSPTTGDTGPGTTTTSPTTGDTGPGTTTTSPTTGDTGPGTTTTSPTTGDTGPGTTTTSPTTGDTGPGTTTTSPTTGDTGPGTTTTSPTTGTTTGAPTPDVPAGTNLPSNLVLSDSFNTGSLNTSVWSPTWFGNTEQQNGTTMSASNVSEGPNGLNLKDTGSTGSIVSTNPDDGQPGHTGFQMTNGYVQFDVNVPASANGQIANWPAFWLVGQPPWPQDGEIDVMEGLGGTAAWHQHYGTDSAVGAGVNSKPGENTYGVNITPTELTFYYDGQEVGQTPNEAPNSPKYLVMENSNTGGQTPQADTVTVQNVSVWE